LKLTRLYLCVCVHGGFGAQELCSDPSNEVLIFSGSEMAKLEETFGDLPLWLAAENGVYVRPPIRPELPQVRDGPNGFHEQIGRGYCCFEWA
jgi:hypothetical protein